MNIYYKIAGFPILIEGSGVAVLKSLRGFSVFKASDYLTAAVVINLEETEPEPIKGNPYYKVTTGNTVCLLYKEIHGYALEIREKEVLQLSMHTDRNESKYYIKGNLTPIFLRYAIWVSFNLNVAHQGAIAIHSSAVIYQGKAILFLGESGTGKSTHTRLICQRFPDAELLNDDSPIVRMENGKCMVYGSPWSGKTACYQDKKVELGAMVRLHQAITNKISLLPVHEAIGALLPSFPPELYLCNNFQPSISALISGIIEYAPVYSMDCLPDEAAAELSIKTFVAHHNGTNRQ